MATRNRTIYNQEELFCSNITGAAGAAGTIVPAEVTQLHRIQSTSYESNISRTDVNEFGVLARLTSLVLEPPSVTLNFDYLLADGHNETGIGLDATTSSPPNALSGILAGAARAEKNFYVMTAPAGIDAHGTSPQATTNQFFNFGNCFLTSHSISLAVGELPTASNSFECSNIDIRAGSTTGVRNPAIVTTGNGAPVQYTGLVTIGTPSTGDLTVAALRPGDIVVDFGADELQIGGPVLPGNTLALTNTAMHVQSVNIEIPLSRTPQNRLGSAFAFSRELDVPINVTLSVSANLADIVEGSIIDVICQEEAARTITVTLYDPCDDAVNMKYELKGAVLDSQNYSNAVGDNAKTVELTFSAQLGGGNDTTRGLFITRKA